ncbi:MAG: TetR/AcrR family transcriptional regulator [Zavarzinia sp.]|nr:TetR/AcrR family transcriptional regulator [Zavarzinia sp.]
MRYSTDHKERSRERILQEASVLLRARGIDGVGLAEIMRHAGLTHGGFYAHFPSREALVADALSAALDQTVGRLGDLVAATPADQRLAAIVRAYLSRQHMEEPGNGCVFAALGGDIGRLPLATREQLAQHHQRLIALIADGLDGLGRPRDQAPVILATMIGSLTMARLMPDAEAGQHLLAEAVTAILA